MKIRTLSLTIILHLLLLSSCKLFLNPAESFDDTDGPVELEHESLSFFSPWGYDKAINAFRDYPLLVSGMWEEGQSYYRASSDEHLSFAEEYPAFVLDYQKPSEGDGQALALWIKSAVEAGYRIDTDRIYLTGFSYGGSSSYPLAKGMYREEMSFAAIIRCAGQSQSDLTSEIAERTAVWYHIGLEDTETRVEVARAALENMREYECNRWAFETKKSDDITGYDRTTVTLTRGGEAMFKYSEYTGMGHTPAPCYKDETLFPWLFSHSLSYR